jgi:hypothetical protein
MTENGIQDTEGKEEGVQQQVPPKNTIPPGENLVPTTEPPKPEKPIADNETKEDQPEELQTSRPSFGPSNSDQVTAPEQPTNQDQHEGMLSRDAKKFTSLARNVDSTIKKIINSLPGFGEEEKKE